MSLPSCLHLNINADIHFNDLLLFTYLFIFKLLDFTENGKTHAIFFYKIRHTYKSHALAMEKIIQKYVRNGKFKFENILKTNPTFKYFNRSINILTSKMYCVASN